MIDLSITRDTLIQVVDRANRLHFERDRMREATERWVLSAVAFEVGDWGMDPGCPLRQAGLEPGGDEVEEWADTFDRRVLAQFGLTDDEIESLVGANDGDGLLVVVRD